MIPVAAVVLLALIAVVVTARVGKFLHEVDHTPSPRVTNVDIRQGDDVRMCPHCHRLIQ